MGCAVRYVRPAVKSFVRAAAGLAIARRSEEVSINIFAHSHNSVEWIMSCSCVERVWSLVAIEDFATVTFHTGSPQDGLVVQNYVEQRAVDLQPTVVVNKAQFPESVHEEADT